MLSGCRHCEGGVACVVVKGMVGSWSSAGSVSTLVAMALL